MSPEAREHSFDELARGLASGSLSRRKALRLMGGLLVASALGSIPGVAWANDDDDDRCPQGQTRCGERCVNLRFNERHCGSCFNRCRSTQSCCNGRCVNLQRNENHCGECFNRCEEGQECVSGECQGACLPNGGTCTADTQCCSGICNLGTCSAVTGPDLVRCACEDGTTIEACATCSGPAQAEVCMPLCASHGGLFGTGCLIINDPSCVG
jgi:Stigma-specific protein, Stig1